MSFASVLARIEEFQNPYPGLRPFETEESHLFFGRDQQIGELVSRLERSRLVAVVGVSGSGKSSLVRAGLIPALERSPVAGARPLWRMVVTRPAGAPFASLAAQLSAAGLDPSGLRRSSHGLLQVAQQLPPRETLLVVVDQFEELFRYKDLQTTEEAERHRREEAASEAAEFVQLLLATTQYLPPVYIVLTMRSDYLGDCAEFRGLPEALNECQYLVPRLNRHQRMEAIQGPLGPTEIAPSLVQRMLNDVGDEPDRLPLLQHALMRTWSQWRKADPDRKRKIELQDYEAAPVGGLEHALDRHAEELLVQDPEAIEITQTIFTRLTAGTRRERRNPTRLDELWEACGAETGEERKKVESVIDRFRNGEATFLTPRGGVLAAETYVDITHESLIREWGRLRKWVADEAESRAEFLRIHDEAQRYAQGRGDLWRDPKLQLTLDWWEAKKPTAAWARPIVGSGATGRAGFEMVRDFLERSRQARQEEVARARQRRLTTRLSVGAVMLAMAGLILWGSISRKHMNTEHRLAVGRALAWASFDDQDEHPDQLERSTLYAIESVKREANSASLHTLQLAARLLRRRTAHFEQKGIIWGISFSPDGKYLATASDEKNVSVYDKGGTRIQHLGHNEAVWSVAFSQDGKRLAMGAADGAWVFDTTSWHEVWHGSEWDQTVVDAVAFSPDSRLLAMGSLHGSVLVWDGKATREVLRHSGPVRAVAFSPDGRYIATGGDDSMLRLTEVKAPSKLLWEKHLNHSVRTVAFSPIGDYLAVGCEDGTARVFDVKSRNEVRQWTHQGAVNAVAFSAGGRYVAAGSDDQVSHVYDMADGREALRQTHKRGVASVAFNPEGTLLASGSVDGTVELTEVVSPDQVARLKLSDRLPRIMALTWNAKHLAVVDEGGNGQVFELERGKPVSPRVHLDDASQVAVSTGGIYFALSSSSEVRVFESSTGKLRFSPQGLAGGDTAIDLTPDGLYLAVGTGNEVRVFDVAKGTLAWQNSDFQQPASSLVFSSDGRQLAVAGQTQELKLFRTETGDKMAAVPIQWYEDDCKELKAPCKLNGIAYSKDGKYVALAGSDKTARVIDAVHGRVVCVLRLPSNVVYATLSEDDRFVATASNDWTGRVYELATSKEVWHMSLRLGDFFPLAFTSKDKYLLLATGSAEMLVERHLWRPQDLIDNACAQVGRSLLPEEWQRLSKETQPQTCPKLP